MVLSLRCCTMAKRIVISRLNGRYQKKRLVSVAHMIYFPQRKDRTHIFAPKTKSRLFYSFCLLTQKTIYNFICFLANAKFCFSQNVSFTSGLHEPKALFWNYLDLYPFCFFRDAPRIVCLGLNEDTAIRFCESGANAEENGRRLQS